LFGHGILENQIQTSSRTDTDTDSRIFKDLRICFQGLSRPWKSGKKFKDFQKPARALNKR